MKYLNEKLVKETFLALRQKEKGGKWGIERTSGLMIFLAFDSLLKRLNAKSPLDLNPETGIGKHNREGLSLQFARLVTLKNSNSKPLHVINFGEISNGEPNPENRFSANFLTVPVKKSTTSTEDFEYPHRPAPLIILGQKATGVKWGIAYHKEWKQNIPLFLAGRKTNTPFHSLACFILRQSKLPTANFSFQESIITGLKETFTDEICDYWTTRIMYEKPYWNSSAPLYQDTLSNSFGDHSWAQSYGLNNEVESQIVRIEYLEGLLKMHHIHFEKNTLL